LLFDADVLAAARIVEYVIHGIASGPGTVGSGHVRTGGEYAHRVVLRGDFTESLQFGTHRLIDLTARGIIGETTMVFSGLAA
jgi:hypothetical protein